MKNKLKILFFGTPQEVVPVLETLHTSYDVVAVVTTPDQPAGRKKLLTPSPVKTYALEKKIPVFQPDQLKIADWKMKIPHADIMVVAAYGKLIPDEIFETATHGAVNIHPSLLPQYRGPTPIQTALLHGDTKSGITFIKIDAELDHGPILHQVPFTLSDTDTFAWLMKSKFAQAAVLLPTVIENYISGSTKPQAQDDTKATYTKMITKEDGHLDLQNPPDEKTLNRMIRAYFPWPTVWATINLRGKDTRIKFLPDNKLLVEGKNPIAVNDFVNGYPEMRETLEKLFT